MGCARGDDEMEYCRGRMGGSMLASCFSGRAILGYLLSSWRTDGRLSVADIACAMASSDACSSWSAHRSIKSSICCDVFSRSGHISRIHTESRGNKTYLGACLLV